MSYGGPSREGIALADSIWQTIMEVSDRGGDVTMINFDDVAYGLAKVLGDVAALGDSLGGIPNKYRDLAVEIFAGVYSWRVEQDDFPKAISIEQENDHGTLQ